MWWTCPRKPPSHAKSWVQWANSKLTNKCKEWTSSETQEKTATSQATYSRWPLNRASVTSKTCLPAAFLRCRTRWVMRRRRTTTRTTWSSSWLRTWRTWTTLKCWTSRWPTSTSSSRSATLSIRLRLRTSRSTSLFRKWDILMRRPAAARRCQENTRLTRMETSGTLTLNLMRSNLTKR